VNTVVGCQPKTPTLTYALSGTSRVLATALLDDQLFVTRHGVAQVSVYDKTSLQLQRQLTTPGLGVLLFGLATCATNNYLYVSDDPEDYTTAGYIHRIDLSATNYPTIKWNACSNPIGLSVNKARNVLVACHYQAKVQEFTANGNLVREIPHNTAIYHVIELSSGMLAVSRWWTIHGVAVISTDGRVIHSYGNESRESGVEKMDNPRHMAVDKDGYILVVNAGNDRILVLNPNLTVTRPLPLPKNTSLQYPIALSLDQSRCQLYIGERGGQNRILVIDNVVNFGAMFNN